MPGSDEGHLLVLVLNSLTPIAVVGFFSVSYSTQRLHAIVAIVLVIIFWIIITIGQLVTMGIPQTLAEPAAGTIMALLPIVLLIVAPAKAVSRRLIFLALGLLLLIALNELSKLGLDVTAPKLG